MHAGALRGAAAALVVLAVLLYPRVGVELLPQTDEAITQRFGALATDVANYSSGWDVFVAEAPFAPAPRVAPPRHRGAVPWTS